MSSQFKKFLLFLVSMVLGILTYNLLCLLSNPNNADLGAPGVAMFYVSISLVGTFTYYHFLRKKFLPN